MTGAMYASIAGLKAHMQKLTVIGNNIANVNTQGYKKQRTIFRDSIYSLYSGGSNGTNVVGGMNPSQLGYGSLIASIDLDLSSASYAPGNPTDCALVGDGFFLVGNKDIADTIDPNNPDSFKALTLSRVGDFHFGADGYLVDGQGNVVYGFMNTTDGYIQDPNYPDDPSRKIPDISDQLVPIRLPHWERVTKETTVEGEDEPIIVETYEMRYAQSGRVTDEEGNRADTGPLKDLEEATGVPRQEGNTTITGQAEGSALEWAKFSSISIDAGSGAITGVADETGEVVTIGYLAVGRVTNPNGVSHVDSSYYKCQEGAGDLNIGMLGGMASDLGIKYVNSYQFEAEEDGGDIVYNSGSAILNLSGTKMMVGFLETSNTDLATEISELITTQRGYQANTRIVTVTDSMLEELVNMKR